MNKLYFAFRELGKVIRTMFLLRYVHDVELRRTIHAATNKNEEFNGFAKWAFFGEQGLIEKNLRHEQRKIVKYNQLVSNLVILYNVEQMTKVIRDQKQEGVLLRRRCWRDCRRFGPRISTGSAITRSISIVGSRRRILGPSYYSLIRSENSRRNVKTPTWDGA